MRTLPVIRCGSPMDSDRNKKPANARGFTLLEILIAVTVLATVLAVTYGSFSAVTDEVKSARDVAEVYQTARITMDRMSMDLQNAFVRSDGSASDDVYRFVCEQTSPDISFRKFSFSSTAHMAMVPDQVGLDLCRISYELRKDEKEKTYTLYRTDVPLFAAPTRDNTIPVVIGLGFTKFTVSFYDSSEQPVYGWDSEGTGQKAKLPKRVEVSFIIKGPDGKEYPFVSGWSLGMNS